MTPMGIERSLPVSVIAAVLLLAAGCYRDSKDLDPAHPNAAGPNTVDYLGRARQLYREGDWDAAAEAVYKALVQDPGNAEATLLASEVEAQRENHQAAVDLLASINIGSRLGKRAIEMRSQQLLKLERRSQAADVLLAGIGVMPTAAEWRHRAWDLLNRTGRREEASLQADVLCRVGLATEAELLSLVRRTDAFPFRLASDQDPRRHFEPGLGMARWYFTQQQYQQALAELSKEYTAGFQSVAGCALYGRLLAETQIHEEMPVWHAKCTPNVTALGDYWAALGTLFLDQRHYEPAARALLEAVARNPSDSRCVSRLAKVFDALGFPDKAATFRERGIELAETTKDAEDLFDPASEMSARRGLTRSMLALGRPFEAIGWTISTLPAGADAKLREMTAKRAELSGSDAALGLPSESALIDIDRDQFSLASAAGLLQGSSKIAANVNAGDVKILARPRLVNVAQAVGLEFRWYQDLQIDLARIPIHESVGGGIAVLDYDLDGWPDIYLAQGSGEPPSDACTRSNELMRNVAGRFEAVTEPAAANDFNYSSGLAAGDVNQDGFADLFLGSAGRNRLLINNGDGTFRDATPTLGTIDDRFTTSLAIADINGDALPDLFEANYIEMEGAFVLPEVDAEGTVYVPAPLLHKADSDRWFANHGDGNFVVHDVSREVAKPGSSLGLMITDFDSDGSNEVFVGNDLRPNHFLVPYGENQLRNLADVKGVANGFSGASNGCMGIAPGDFNRDGEIDLHITNFYGESANLYLQTTGGFTDYASRFGLEPLSHSLVGFGTKAVDVDRNGWLDLIVTNGHIFDLRHAGHEFEMPPQMLMSRGNRFELATVDDDIGYWQQRYLGRSMASLDFDRDGAIDFLVGHLVRPLALLRNETQCDGQWIQLECVGTESERDATGTRFVVTAGREQFTQWVTAGDGYLCSDESVLDFGLADHQGPVQVDVFWPTGKKQSFSQLEPGHRYLVVEGEAEAHRR